jgi:hypothetical protein
VLSTAQLFEGSADCPRHTSLSVVVTVHRTPFLKVVLSTSQLFEGSADYSARLFEGSGYVNTFTWPKSYSSPVACARVCVCVCVCMCVQTLLNYFPFKRFSLQVDAGVWNIWYQYVRVPVLGASSLIFELC